MVTLTEEQFEKYLEEMKALTLRANPPEVLTPDETGDFLTLHLDTVRARAALGEIPSKKIGKRMVFLRDDVLAWLRGVKK